MNTNTDITQTTSTQAISAEDTSTNDINTTITTANNIQSNDNNDNKNNINNIPSIAGVATVVDSNKIIVTSTACIAAACITYPAEMYRLSFTNQALATWNFERNAAQVAASASSSLSSLSSLSSSLSSTNATSSNNMSSTTNMNITNIRSTSNTNSSFVNLLRSSAAGIMPKTFGPFAQFFSHGGKRKQKIRIVVSPMVRLISHEMALTMTTKATTSTTTTTTSRNSNSHSSSKQESFFMNQITAGAIAGLCQALLLCPLEIHRANQIMYTEQQEKTGRSIQHWMRWIKIQIKEVSSAGGGAGVLGNVNDPYERRQRALQGVGILALREMMFNICFFPLFYKMKWYLDDRHGSSASIYSTNNSNHIEKDNNKTSSSFLTPTTLSSIKNVILSGIVSGTVCSFAMIPLDVLKTYLFYSREQWNVWTGKNVIGPPFRLLGLGLTMQALVFGPTFGIVAAIYELT